MRLLVDYRPALRARTGVGEWVHNLVRGLLKLPPRPGGPTTPEVTVFVSSWKDRPPDQVRRDLPGVTLVDRRVPVRLLTIAWNRLGWPPVEALAGGRYDAVLSATPLLVPCRAPVRAVTVHDLDFLDHPDRTRGEMRRDFPALVARHVARADIVVVISHFTAAEVTRRLAVPDHRIVVCRPGVPDWVSQVRQPLRPPRQDGGNILFVGTLEPRKNIAGLLSAYERLIARMPDAPPLVLAGAPVPGSDAWVSRTKAGPLAGRVDVRGYVAPDALPALYSGARMLVLPSYMEGFGIPVLEAMALGIPVLVSSRGALPEVVGNAGLILDPDDAEGWAQAMGRVLSNPGLADDLGARGRVQAARFAWPEAAAVLAERLAACVESRRQAGSAAGRRADAHRH